MFRVGEKYQHLAADALCACASPAVHAAMARITAQLSRRGFLAGLGAVAAATVFGGDAALAQQATPPPSTLFTNVNVFTGLSLALRRGMSVLVENGRITAMQAGTMAAPAGATIIDGGGRTLMPGLIDNHVHVFLSASTEAQLLDPAQTYESMNARALAEAKAMLLRGFTAVRDMGGPVFPLKTAIDKGAPGPRIWPSGAMISQTSGHGDFRTPAEKARRFGARLSRGEELGAGFIVDGRDEVLTATRENLRFGASQIKVMAGGGAASAYDPLDVAQYTLDELKAAVDAASDWNTYVTVHAYTVKAVRRAIEAGVKCIEHGQLLDEPTVKLLADKGIWLSLQALDPAPPTATQNVRDKKAQVVQGTDNAFRWAKRHKVKLAFGTDILLNPAATTNQITDFVKLKQWFTPAEALKLATHDNAQLLALSGPRNPYPGKLGVVEVGALADLLLVQGDPTQDLGLIGEPGQNFKLIMKGGQIHKNTL
jgi:imidazolonepropionase-like amidohydrolase